MDFLTASILIQDGITSGAIYVLLAVALVMVFTVTRIVLVPQGEFVSFSVLTIAAFEQGHVPSLTWLVLGAAALACLMEVVERARLRDWRGWPSRLAVFVVAPVACVLFARFAVGQSSPYALHALAAVLLVTSLGPLLYRIAFKPLVAATPLVLLIAAIALHFVLVGMGLYVFGPEGSRLQGVQPGMWQFGPFMVNQLAVVVVLVSGVLIAALYLFFEKTLMGKALRATAVSRSGAQLVGISPNFAGELSLTLAAFIGAVSGVLIGPMTTIYYDSGFLMALKGFVGAIVGGLAGYLLAGLGSLCVGLLEAFASYWASALKEIIVFTLIVPVLMWRSRVDPHASEEEQ